jgi:hypothetical protein
MLIDIDDAQAVAEVAVWLISGGEVGPTLELCRMTTTTEAAARTALAAELPELARAQLDTLAGNPLEPFAIGAIVARVDWQAVADAAADHLSPKRVERIRRAERQMRREARRRRRGF